MKMVDGPKEGVRDLKKAIEDGILYESKYSILYERTKGGEDKEVQARLFSLVVQLAFAMEYLHGRGVVHQDIKPGNILIDARSTEQWRLVLTDFGTASFGDVDSSGAIRGADLNGCTPRFCSKKVYRDFKKAQETGQKQCCTHAADLWCFASTVVQMYHGKGFILPLHAQTVNFESALADFRVVPPQGLQDLLLKLLVDEPELTARQLVKALLKLPGAPAKPQAAPGIERQSLSIIHSNLGLAFHSRGHLPEAQQQYARAIEMDPSRAQTIEFRVETVSGQACNPNEFKQELWEVVQAKLRLILGGNHPIACQIRTTDALQDGVICVDVIRAALWDQMTKVGVVTDVGFLQVLRDEILDGRFEVDLEERLCKVVKDKMMVNGQGAEEKETAEATKKGRGREGGGV
jgi:hypothetical protein